MNTIKWVLLCVVFILYLLAGGSIIMLLEQGNEISQNEQLAILRKDIQEILFRLDRDFYHNGTSADILEAVASAKEGVLNRISDSCGGKNLLDTNENVEDKPLTWTFYNSVFFAFTAVTTIGYGNLTPVVPVSRIFTIIYALFGIPINGIIISGLSDYYSRKLVKAHKRTKDKRSYDARVVFIFDIIFYLIPGILVFIVAPAGFFVVIEKWSFIDSIYFCFVTLSTIGFGDYVAGLGDGHNLLLWLYKIIIIVWIMFGLGYLLMILSFITKGMTSKKVRTVIEKRLHGIKSTKEKLSKDIDYMRRVVQELYLMKAKPAFGSEIGDGGAHQGDLHHNHNGTHRTPAARRYTTDVRRNVSFNMNHLSNTRRGVPHVTTLVRSRSESELDKLNKSTINADTTPDWTLSDEVMANLVAAITGEMNEMIHAVDQLNEYEHDLNAAEYANDESPEEDARDEDNDFLDDWRLEEFDSDEEILIEDDEDSGSENLEQVIVHSPQGQEPTKPPETFIEKIGEAFRKISASMTEGPSRKISRNEAQESRRPVETAQSFERGSPIRQTVPTRRDSRAAFDQNDQDVPSHKISRNPMARAATYNVPLNKEFIDETIRKISTGRPPSRCSGSSDNLRFDDQHFINNSSRSCPTRTTPLESGQSSQRISLDNTGDAERKRFSLERKSLQELLKTLDNVQDRLHNGDFPDRLRRQSVGHAEEAIPHRRRRKVGIFNPGFSFMDSAFGKDGNKPHGV